LKEFDRIAIDSTIHLQKPFTQPVEVVHEYPLSSEDSEEGKAYLAINKVIGPVVDPETYLAFGILEYILLGTPSAPLKKALLNAGIAKDIYGDFSNNSLQTYFSIFAKYADPNDAGKFRTIVRETLTRLADKGLDPKLVEAAINKKEFHLREAEIRSYPKGLFYAFKLLDSWLYDGDPFMHIQYGETLRKIKGRLGYFEELIRKYLLDNPHGSFVSLVPRKGLNEENAEKLRSKLAEFRASLSEAEIDAILEETAALHQKQITPDSPEALASIPRLQLADVNREAEELPLQVESLEGKELLTHPQFTNQIAYLSLYFDSRTVPQDKLPYLSLLPQVLGQVSTTARDYSDLINEINLHTGGISFDTDAMETSSDDSEYSPRVIVRTKALVSKFPQLISLLNEIIHNTRFDEDFRLREILRQAKADIGGYLMSAGHIAVMRRLHSYHSPMYRYLERMNNVEQIRFIMDMEKNLEENLPLIRQNLEEVFHLVFRAENLRISLAAETDDLPKLRAPLAGLIRGMDSTVVPVHEYVFESGNTNEGFVTPANVQYVAKGYNFRKLGHEYSGSAAVLSNVIQLGYLLAKVRIQGGAYGAFCGFSHNGISFFCSYRDPHLRNTLKVYDELPDFVESINLTDRELLNYILGVISQQDMPLSPSQKAERVTRYHFRGLTREKNQAIRDQILGTRVEQLRAFAPVLRRMMGKNVICVLGNEGKLRENADLFGALINLFK
jgi:Zn-dependent M16 (insulinase) family peptidase